MLFCICVLLLVDLFILKLLLVEEKTISLNASQILFVTVGSHLKETNISHLLLHS